MPCVSIVLPFYNRTKWLIEAVDSVFAQTYSDFEIIIVNDGSSEIFNHLEEFHDERVKYFEQVNMGPAGTRNTGIDKATGKYIAFLDSDDLFEPQKLENQVRLMEANPDVAMSHTSYARITSEGEFIEEVNLGRFSGDVYPKIISHCPIATPTVMVRRDAINSLRFVETARAGEDIMFWLRIAKEGKILGIRESFSKVRIHGENAAQNPDIVLNASLKIINYAFEHDPNLKTIFRLKSISRIYRCVSNMYFNSKDKPKAAQSLSKAIYYYPFAISNYLLAVLFLLPEPLRASLKKFSRFLRSRV